MSLSVFTKIPIPAVELEHLMHYADSAVGETKLRKHSVSGELKSLLHRHLLDLKLNPQYLDHLNIYDCVAKCFNLGVNHHPTLDQNQLWIFASILILFLFEFDDHFDNPLHLTPENTARLSKEMRAVLRSLSRHNLSGLQGGLEDWPAEVPGKEAYLWLLREAEDLKEGAAELTHGLFVDYCFGVEEEVIEWKSDTYRGDLTAWSLDRYKEVRKRTAAGGFAIVVPLFVTYKWIQKEHVHKCTDLLYEASLLLALSNDILGIPRDRRDSATMTALKIASTSEVVQHHNEMVEVLHKKVLALEGNTKHFMEEVEASVVGFFLWQCHSKRYTL
nr:terpene synthase-like protein uBuTS-14 [Bubarida sp. uBuTS-14]